MAADHRSALPRVPGIPWWGAIVLAVTFTAIGFAYDAGSGAGELSAVFAVCYGAGCVLAVLAVRQSGVFTAVIQPPLILFISVPTAYYLFHGDQIAGIKDILINCGYPLIERFPLMFFTSAIVLAIGLARWYVGKSARRNVATDDEAEPVEAPEKPKRSRTRPATDATTVLDAVEETPRRRSRERSGERADRPARSPRSDVPVAAEDDLDSPRRPRRSPRPPATGSPSRSRHTRPPEADVADPAPRPRRRSAPPVDPEPRARSRGASGREPRREPRRDLPPIDGPERRERRERRERPDRWDRPDRFDAFEGYDRPDRGEPRRRRRSEYEGFEPPDGFDTGPRTSGGTNGNHHPVSRVRYRGQNDGEPESRPRPRRPYASDADSWEYDV